MRHKENFLLQNVGGENLLVPLGSEVMDINGIVTLNRTAAYLWTLLDENRSEDDLAIAVTDHFAVDREQALADVRIFLEELGKKGMLA